MKPRKIFGELHQKTHFKAAYTIYLNYNSCLQDKAAKAIRTNEDLKEEFRYRTLQDEPYFNIKNQQDLVKSYDNNMQRTYEDFDIQTDDSIVAVSKDTKRTADNVRKSQNVWLNGKEIKSLSPDFTRSQSQFGVAKTLRAQDVIEMMKTRNEVNNK